MCDKIKKILAVLLVLCMILVTPSYAAVISDNGQNFDQMNVKGKGIDATAANEIINKNNSENLNSSNETSNNITGTLYTMKNC